MGRDAAELEGPPVQLTCSQHPPPGTKLPSDGARDARMQTGHQGWTGEQKVAWRDHPASTRTVIDHFPGVREASSPAEFGASFPCVALGKSLPLCEPRFPCMSYLETCQDMGGMWRTSPFNPSEGLGFSHSESIAVSFGWWVAVMVW